MDDSLDAHQGPQQYGKNDEAPSLSDTECVIVLGNASRFWPIWNTSPWTFC